MSSWLDLAPEWHRARRRDDDLAPPPPPPVPERPRWFVGLDLGQLSDFSALAAVERTKHPHPTEAGKTEYHFAVRHLHRWPLGTPYPVIVENVKALFAAPPLGGERLVVDATGVGRGVVDMFRAAGIAAQMQPYTITGGESAGAGTVPKKNLIGAVQAPLCGGRLKFAAGLALTPVLARELETFRAKVTAARNEVFEAWRERDHDDLVLALALALYVGSFGEIAWAVAYL